MLRVENLKKVYPTFTLDNVSFELPAGYIMGFIGANGAGKSTTLKALMNIVHPDGGRVEFFGKDMSEHEVDIKQHIGFLMGAVDSYPHCKVKKLISVTETFYDNWDDGACRRYIKKFGIDPDKRVKELSAGMKVKLGLIIALSHGAKLYIFDEPTSGLDPIARDEILDVMQELVEDGERSVLFSTHITGDLDKCADYVLFIKNGIIVANDTKDALIEGHMLVKGGTELLTDRLKERLIGFKKHGFGFVGLLRGEDAGCAAGLQKETPNLEDIMVYYNREENDA